MATSNTCHVQPLPPEDIADVILHASRSLVAIAARSLADVQDDVTLPQYRAIVVLCARGPISMGELAEALDCSGSTATRLCDRLVAKDLVARSPREENRREVEVRAAPAGTALLKAVTKRRRAEIQRIAKSIPVEQQPALVDSLRAFADAAGEAPDQAWSTGWDL
jgi:DNA-binding MarR family transcriptional regulator